MNMFLFLLVYTFVAGFFGLCALGWEAAWKISSETTGSSMPATRWIYRHLFFSFFFALSFLLISPLTTWQLTKIPEIQAFGRAQPWLLFALNVPPALLLYWFHRKFVRWCDPVKVKARKKLAARVPLRGR